MRFLLSLFMLCGIGLAAALVLFIQSIPPKPADALRKTDSIIVLTGGPARVERGLNLLAEGAAPTLFISGVGAEVTVNEMLTEHAKPSVRAKISAANPEIIFDRVADSTQTNANLSAEFVKSRGITSIRLITAQYHMPRSLSLFRAAMPGVEILADPVAPDDVVMAHWWRDEASRMTLFREFFKWSAVKFRSALR